MTIPELDQVIRESIMNIYHKCYTGKIDIQKLDPIGYCIRLGMNTPYQPLVIYAELEDDKFIKFLKDELKAKRFNLVYYGQVISSPTYMCNQRNTSCNDK